MPSVESRRYPDQSTPSVAPPDDDPRTGGKRHNKATPPARQGRPTARARLAEKVPSNPYPIRRATGNVPRQITRMPPFRSASRHSSNVIENDPSCHRTSTNLPRRSAPRSFRSAIDNDGDSRSPTRSATPRDRPARHLEHGSFPRVDKPSRSVREYHQSSTRPFDSTNLSIVNTRRLRRASTMQPVHTFRNVVVFRPFFVVSRPSNRSDGANAHSLFDRPRRRQAERQ